MATDDLAGLFPTEPAGGVGYRQGTVLTWDQTTAENTILVDGTVFTDLPIFNTSEAQLLVPGAVVGILTVGSSSKSWFVLGRLTIPGTPEAASALSLISSRILVATDPTSGTRTSSSFGDLTGAAVGPSITANIGPSGKALVLWAAGWGHEFNGVYDQVSAGGISVEVTGATSMAPSGEFAVGHLLQFPSGQSTTFSFQCGMVHVFTDLNPGANTFTLKYRNLENTHTVTFTSREIAVFAL